MIVNENISIFAQFKNSVDKVKCLRKSGKDCSPIRRCHPHYSALENKKLETGSGKPVVVISISTFVYVSSLYQVATDGSWQKSSDSASHLEKYLYWFIRHNFSNSNEISLNISGLIKIINQVQLMHEMERCRAKDLRSPLRSRSVLWDQQRSTQL